MNKKGKVAKVVKKVIGHLNEDTKDYKKGIREDKKLRKELKKKV